MPTYLFEWPTKLWREYLFNGRDNLQRQSKSWKYLQTLKILLKVYYSCIGHFPDSISSSYHHTHRDFEQTVFHTVPQTPKKAQMK